MQIEREALITAPPDAVWRVLTDPSRATEWMPDVVSYETEDAEARVGTLSTLRVREGGKEVEYQTEIRAWHPTDKLVVDIRGGSLGPNPMRVTYLLRSSGDATRLTYQGEWQAGTFFLKLMVPVIKWAAGHNANQAMERLGAVVNRDHSP